MQRDIFQDHFLADAIGSDEYGVVSRVDAGQGEELSGCLAIDLLWPHPVEVGHGSCTDVRVARARSKPRFWRSRLFDGEDLTEQGLPMISSQLAMRPSRPVLARGEWDGHGGRQPALGAESVELAHGADVHGVVLKDLDQSILEGIGPDAIEQLK